MARSSGVWERVADGTAGDVASLASATTSHGRSVPFAATAVGVYRSTNGSRSWTLPASGASVPFGEAIAVSPRFAADQTIFVCAGDALYRSTDGGEVWHKVLVGSRMLATAVACAAGPETLVVLAGTEADGILRSEDAGRAWAGANAGLLDLTALTIVASPRFASDRLGFAGTASGLYRTRNRSEEHTSELQSRFDLVCRLLLEKKKNK